MFLVIEMQTNNGVISNIATSHDTMAEADNKYYTILAAAAISNVPKHGAVIIDEDCHLLRGDCYAHEE